MRNALGLLTILCLAQLMAACGGQIEKQASSDGGQTGTARQTLMSGVQPPMEGAAPEGDDALFSAGAYHGCAIKGDNTLSCWGKNDKGQATPPAGTFRAVSAGNTHTCALKTDGSLACWGENAGGQSTPPAGVYQALTSGANHSCALRDNGTATCWGDNTNGQAPSSVAGPFLALDAGGNATCGIAVDSSVTCWGALASPAASVKVLSISTGDGHACGLLTNHQISCWGDFSETATGPFVKVAAAGDDFFCAVEYGGKLFCQGYNGATAPTVPTTGTYVAITAGAKHMCAIDGDSYVRCFGDNTYGQARVPNGLPMLFSSIDMGNYHACGIKKDNSLVCWGDNAYGNATPPSGSYSAISAGSLTSCAIRNTEKTLACWGDPSADQLNYPGLVFLNVSVGFRFACGVVFDFGLFCWGAGTPPGKPAGSFASVSAGSDHACAIRLADNTVVCWGNNDNGKATPPAGAFLSVTAGAYHTCGVKTDATVACWGKNTSHQSSPPSGEFRSVAVDASRSCGIRTDKSVVCWGDSSNPPPPGLSLASISGAWVDICGVTPDGLAVCWGSNYGGSGTPPMEPITVIRRSVGVGNTHGCMVKPEPYSTLSCWGNNSYGQATPPAGHFRSVGSSGDFSCGLTSSGTISCWGSNSSGQVSGAPTNSGFVDLSLGGAQACGLRTDGSISCWGDDSDHRISGRPSSSGNLSVTEGGAHGCTIAADRTLTCWGYNGYGQATPPSGTFREVRAGSMHTCGLRTDGTVSCWGAGTSNTGSSYQYGQAIAPSGTFIALSAGDLHTCGLKADGSIVCWGQYATGQNAPPPGSYVSIDAGGTFSCAVNARGFVTCWGANNEHQAENPVLTPATLPNGTFNVAYSQTLSAAYTGYTGGFTYFVSAGALPNGLTLNESTGAITGKPTKSGSFSFAIGAYTTTNRGASQSFSVTIACQNGYSGPSCLPICYSLLADNPAVCGGHGICASPNTCQCIPNTGYTGLECTTTTCGDGYLVGSEKCEKVGGVFGECCDSTTCAFKSTAATCGTPESACLKQDYCNGAGACLDRGNKDDGTSCDDGNPQTRDDKCAAGVCVGVSLCAGVTCTASDQCHDAGTCDPATGQCSNPSKADGSDCIDGNACTQTDTCQGGICVGASPVVCLASDQCHDAGACNPATGQCSNPMKGNGSECNADSSGCTVGDNCQAGTCVAGAAADCSAASDQCSVGTCVSSGNTTYSCTRDFSLFNDALCNADSSGCTTDDKCRDGACHPGAQADCSAENDTCNKGVCQSTGENSHTCVKNPTPFEGRSCDADGNGCTVNDYCQAGSCRPGENANCASAADSCNEGLCQSTGVDSFTCAPSPLPDNESCNDKNPCTQTDSCQAGICVGAQPVVCTALDSCHDAGVCNAENGECEYAPLPDWSICGTNQACFAAVCEDLPAGDTCGLAIALELDAALQVPLNGHHAYREIPSGCLDEAVSGANVFFSFAYKAGKSYRLSVAPDEQTDVAVALWSDCASVNCVGGSNELGLGKVEVLNLPPAALDGTMLVQVVNVTPKKNSITREFSIRLTDVTPADGDVDDNEAETESDSESSDVEDGDSETLTDGDSGDSESDIDGDTTESDVVLDGDRETETTESETAEQDSEIALDGDSDTAETVEEGDGERMENDSDMSTDGDNDSDTPDSVVDGDADTSDAIVDGDSDTDATDTDTIVTPPSSGSGGGCQSAANTASVLTILGLFGLLLIRRKKLA